MRIERAAAEHLAGVRAIAASYGNLDEWPEHPDALDFELAEGALWVAHARGAVVGYAGVVRHGEIAHLADLFVARDRLGHGIGGALLDAALPRDGVRTTFASGDERALPLYVRAGLRPFAPLLYLGRREGAAPAGAARAPAVGPPGAAPSPAAAASSPAAAASSPAAAASSPAADGFERAPAAAVAARDAAASRRNRPDLLAFLEAAGAYALIGRRPGCYAVVRPAPAGAWVGPAAAGAAELLAVADAVLAAHGGVRLALGGAHPALAPLLARGFRILGSDTYMASHDGVVDLHEYLPEPDLG